MSAQRGVVAHRERNLQVRDYSGLLYGKITPTDIDAIIEYNNRGYIIIETKYGDTEMPFGQRLALERLCDDLHCRKPTILILTSHTFRSEIDIDMAQTIVVEFRFNGKWIKPQSTQTAKQMSDRFVAYLETNN